MPAYNNSNLASQGNLFLGDGSKDISAGGFLTAVLGKTHSGKWSLVGGLAYLWRSDDFSASVPWALQIKYATFDHGFFFEVGPYGLISLKTDHTLPDINGSRTSLGSGGDDFSDAINPALFALKGRVGFAISKRAALTASASQSFLGTSAPKGFSIGGGVQFSWDQIPDVPAAATQNGPPGFVDYNLDSKVTAANDRLNLVKIDKGKQAGVVVGQIFDIFEIKPNGEIGLPVARAVVSSTKEEEAMLTVNLYYREVWIQPEFIAKRPVEP